MERYDVIIVGGGLAGITCGIELSQDGYNVLILEKESHMGGRTASWDSNGMEVDAGFHRVIGYYKQYPKLLQQAGISLNDIVVWEENLDVLSPNHKHVTTFGVAPFHGPIKILSAMIGNNKSISPKAKRSLVPFFKNGLHEFKVDPKKLDQTSILDFARGQEVHEDAIYLFIEAMCRGIFFTPSEDFSAYVFFGILAPAPQRFYKMRIGSYLGGMSDVMIGPLVDYFENLGGEVALNQGVKRLLVAGEKVEGVDLGHEKIYADQLVLATDIGAAQNIISQSQLDQINFYSLLKLPTMPAISVQIELTEPVLEHDRTTFAPGTVLGSFSEQSRSTFSQSKGRLSVMLASPEKLEEHTDEELLELIYKEAEQIGISMRNKVIDYRVVRHDDKFYSVAPGHDLLRPRQSTVVPGLTLAGDYTKQPYLSTMEGAVLSGELASENVKKALRCSQ
ncbi:15-cis-phytoene desaturase [Alkalibacillus filiformis]|uniref:15-cis-phytoene desaturase n=1 Tax=Alkalibacillus filiformis TaxID=200990 RepID=A0ABU0DUW6_9BACI|nr:FAD-dependent oxidoreductase [Alkalibacillus filiformis]MDQ0352251.1 15-cis-phytoene desaturase [Alkalibacillus filiformis]